MKQYFEHKLETDDIIIRQDDSSDTFLETNAGLYFPLVKINDYVLSSADILSFELEVGSSFLPELTITVNDDQMLIRESQIKPQLSYLTLFLGNPLNTVYRPIKNNYLITEYSSEPGSGNIKFECILHVPELYTDMQQFITGTSFKALQQIAETSGLGFVSNISDTNDSMTWLSPGKRMEFVLDTIKPGIYISDTDSFELFVDQYANLNLISLQTAMSSTATTNLETDVLSGEAFEEPDILTLSNNRLERKKNELLITYYSPVNAYGSHATRRAKEMSYTILEDDEITEQDKVTIEGGEQLRNTTSVTKRTNRNTHAKYEVAQDIAKHNRHLLQTTKLDLILDNYAPPAFMFMTVPVQIFNYPTRTERPATSDDQTLQDTQQNDPTLQTNAHVLNESLSGDAIMTATTFKYRSSRSRTNTKHNYRLQQTMRVFLKPKTNE